MICDPPERMLRVSFIDDDPAGSALLAGLPPGLREFLEQLIETGLLEIGHGATRRFLTALPLLPRLHDLGQVGRGTIESRRHDMSLRVSMESISRREVIRHGCSSAFGLEPQLIQRLDLLVVRSPPNPSRAQQRYRRWVASSAVRSRC